jgi:hypothetical protein
VFENRVLSRIFGPGREEVVGGWRKRRVRWAEHIAHQGMRNAYKIFVGERERKNHLVNLDINGCTIHKVGVYKNKNIAVFN